MKLGLSASEAADAIGSRVLLRQMEKAGWVKPVLRRHKLTLFDCDAICGAWERIKKGEVPTV